jgi:hypothetical protein
MPLTPQEFVSKWKRADARERQSVQELDEAVFAAYGWRPDLTDEEILEKLLSLNLERSKLK